MPFSETSSSPRHVLFPFGLVCCLLATASPLFGASGLREINPPAAPDPAETIALIGARLIDGRGGSVVENSIVIVRGERIVAAGAAADMTPPPEAKRMDVAGLSLLPGLIDSHFHSINDQDLPARFLDNGVTTFRDPGHPFRFYQAVEQSDRPQPRVFLTGAHLDAYPPIWPQQAVLIGGADQARAAVRSHVERGATAIKIYFRLPLEYFAPICETAAELDVNVTAHLELVRADDAIRAGVRGIEHVTSFGTALADEAAAARFVERVAADPRSRTDLRYEMWNDIDLNDPARTKPLLDLIVEHQVFVSPTLAVFEKRADDATSAAQVRGFEQMLRFVGMCHTAGAVVVAGSHTYVPGTDLGLAFQRELELLVEAGLTPLEAIQSGTLHNARFFDTEDRLGSIEAGNLADLILVEGRPDEDITDLRRVRRVMLNGRWIAPAR